MYNEDVKKVVYNNMKNLNELILNLGISKVKLSKYLGVSRQMIYNYLAFNSPKEWPLEKKALLTELFNVKDFTDAEFGKIDITPEYIMNVENKLSNALKSSDSLSSYFSDPNINKSNKILLMETTSLLKELLIDDKSGKNAEMIKYLYYFLRTSENIPETRYILAYMAKNNCFIEPDEVAFNEDRQFILEGILFSALNLYNSGRASRDKIGESRKKFIEEIARKNEEKLGRTQKLKAINAQALKELGYNEVTAFNSNEYIEKVAEIEARKGILTEK